MTFVVAGVVLLLALLVGTVFDDDEPTEDDPAVYASSSNTVLASWRSGVSKRESGAFPYSMLKCWRVRVSWARWSVGLAGA